MTDTPTKHSIAAVARALCAASCTSETIEAARVLLVAGRGAELFTAVLAVHKREDEQVTTVLETAKTLERLMSRAPDLAGDLLVRLYPVASRAMLHATCDAIELWMNASVSPALALRLEQLAKERIAPRLQKQCVAWARAIRARV